MSMVEDPHYTDEHLGYRLLKSLRRSGGRTQLIDRTEERKVMSKQILLGAATALARRWRGRLRGKRVGVVLPPGAGATITNLALVLLDRIPVNLNFTAGEEALRRSMKTAEIDTVITAAAMRQKVKDFPWPEKVIDVRRELRELGKLRVLCWAVFARFSPLNIVAMMLGTPRIGGRKEAGLLFTSGSSGWPKGVPLSHANILGQTSQINETGLLSKDRHLVLSNLPVFHSFGFTVTMWYLLLEGIPYVTVPTPLEIKKNAEAIDEEQVTVVFSTPTFLRPWLRKVDKGQIDTLEFIITGAEKLPGTFRETFEKTFDTPLLEGYGLTETSPVVSVNLPERLVKEDRPTQKKGSVGRPLPGVHVKTVHPDSHDDLPAGEQGILCLRGVNIFEGYLAMPEENKDRFQGPWLVTGDIGRVDEEGFLFIEGRVSRFSKIGGEMVSHASVEDSIREALGWEGEEDPEIMILAEEVENKGESLVLLSTKEIKTEDLRQRLREHKLPNLYVPKRVQVVEEIPKLVSGKYDLRKCRDLLSSGKTNEKGESSAQQT